MPPPVRHGGYPDYRRLVIKVGSNVLASANGLPDDGRMVRLTGEIAALKRAGREVVLVSSGAVASGRALVEVPDRYDEVAARQLLASVGQVHLIRRYAELFREHGLLCSQVLVTKEDFRDKVHYRNMHNCLDILLQQAIIPVVNENDVVSVSELMFTDNDELAALLAGMVRADALIILTNVDGLYTGDPGDPASSLLPEVPPALTDLSGYVRARKSEFGRGGMLTKSEMARRLARLGIPVHLANGRKDGALEGVLNGTLPHTYFPPLRKASGQKLRIAHAEVKAVVQVNDGAKAALLGHRASSLLPVGVTAITGDFGKNDIIRIVDAAGMPIGIGQAQYDSATAKSLMGKQREKPLVHYDYLYIHGA